MELFTLTQPLEAVRNALIKVLIQTGRKNPNYTFQETTHGLALKLKDQGSTL